MRKTRLVILPTKCLHQMGFLLLFLSCPVIGDWGRIRPDNENLQRAIKVEREGTCGLQRDTPGGFRDYRDEKGFNIRRFREDDDSRMSRFNEERSLTRNRLDERRERSAEFRRERDSQERSFRSRSAEPRRNDRTDIRSRSLSLSRLEAVRRQTRRETDGERKLSLARRMNERENGRRIERESERITPVHKERVRGGNERSVQRLSLQRREDEMRRQDRNIRGESERRLSLSRTEENLRRIQRSERRETTEREAIERRQPELKRVRNDIRNEREKLVRMERDVNNRREGGNRRQVAKRDERRMDVLDRRVDVVEKTRRVSAAVNHQEYDKTESFFMGAKKWLNLENYESPMFGDWSSSCVIGAVAYYLSTRQTKTV